MFTPPVEIKLGGVTMGGMTLGEIRGWVVIVVVVVVWLLNPEDGLEITTGLKFWIVGFCGKVVVYVWLLKEDWTFPDDTGVFTTVIGLEFIKGGRLPEDIEVVVVVVVWLEKFWFILGLIIVVGIVPVAIIDEPIWFWEGAVFWETIWVLWLLCVLCELLWELGLENVNCEVEVFWPFIGNW